MVAARAAEGLDRVATTDLNELLRKLESSLSVQVEEVPAGFKTCEAWATEFGKSRSYTHKLLTNGVSQGIMERKRIRIESGSRIYPVPHYRQI